MTEDNYSKLIPELYCTDYQRSLRFYTEVLGFSVDYAREEEGFAMLNREGERLMIDLINLNEQKRAWVSAELNHPFGRGMNIILNGWI